jgi:Ankyrin repeats (3 copies)
MDAQSVFIFEICGFTCAWSLTHKFHRMLSQSTFESLFRVAVDAVDSGDENRLHQMLQANPELATQPLLSPGKWLTDQIGNALKTFFKDPYLLWFVSEDAVRNNTLPRNIARIAQIIIGKAKEQHADTLKRQLDYGIKLVAWSWVARESGVQIALLDVFINAGASTFKVSDDALVNGNFAAAEYLVQRGAPLSLSTALCTGKLEQADVLAVNANHDEKQFSLVLCSLNGKADAVKKVIGYGIHVSEPSRGLYSHATPLHHATASGSLDTVKVLVEAGAKMDIRDSVHEGTPLDWAEYLKKEDIAVYLREQAARVKLQTGG